MIGTPPARAPRESPAARRPTRGGRCARARRCSRASSISRSIAACSLRRRAAVEPGRVAAADRRADRLAQQRAASSACTSSGSPSAARTGIASRRSASLTCSNSSTPDGTEEALEAEHARRARAARGRARCRARRRPRSRRRRGSGPRAARRLASSAATVVVAGMLLSGMSTSVVTPPAAAARVACLEPFPVGAARIVDVDVRVDEPGHARRARRRRCRRTPARPVGVVRSIADDAAVVDVDRRRAHAVRQARRARCESATMPWCSARRASPRSGRTARRSATKISLRFSRPKRVRSNGR